MASKMCCTADQDDRSESPVLPARVSDATPAKRPLLPKRNGSQASRFTSARSEELHELRQIFESATDNDSKENSPARTPRSRFSRPSIYSLHSLYKIKSVGALIKRKMSKDLSRSSPATQPKSVQMQTYPSTVEPDTVVKVPRGGPNVQLKITKSDLRRDLLSDKQPDEGGYDPDAEVLDDVARQVGKRASLKRPSLHSIEWTSSPASSKPTPGSSNGRNSSDFASHSLPYQLSPLAMTGTMSTPRFSLFSTPNLCAKAKFQERKLRRSHSAASVERPVHSPITAIRLPSFSGNEADAVPWAISMQESLRLSQFPIPPGGPATKPSKVSLSAQKQENQECDEVNADQPLEPLKEAAVKKSVIPEHEKLSIHVQEPTASPRPSDSLTKTPERVAAQEKNKEGRENDNEEDEPRRSLHLYSMRISHHLRSGSLLSWDHLTSAPDLPALPRLFRDRTVSDQSRVSHVRSRYDRQTSSSGFASSKVPGKWGRVLHASQREEMSSIYSSRPHSPPDSFGGSFSILPLPSSQPNLSKSTTAALPRSFSDTFSNEHGETPKVVKRYGLTNFQALRRMSTKDTLLTASSVARNNSVANTKKSKFREEFSPSPPRKKSTAGISIMKILRPRNSVRSQSETNLKMAVPRVDGPSDTLYPATQRERRMSRSVMSLQKEKESVGKDSEANPIWERALQSYQDERSAFFLPQNKSLAVTGSPSRERRRSMLPRSNASMSSLSPAATIQGDRALSSTLEVPDVKEDDSSAEPWSKPMLISRRSALVQAHNLEMDSTAEIQAAFDKQTDSAATVGAWGRYPSHTRLDRTSSASQLDSVQTRDFALEAAIKFAQGEEDIEPTMRPESPTIGGKKRKKKIGSGRMAKSHSMTFGKTFLKNYAKIFRSQSTEFQRHGQGHRSSITAGGTLEYPELEILPEVWRRAIVEDRENGHSRDDEEDNQAIASCPEPANRNSKDKGKQRAEDSMATLRPHPTPNDKQFTLDGGADALTPTATDRARVWSAYYYDCLPSFPRVSTDIGSLSHSHPNLNDLFELQEFGIRPSTRRSLESKRASMQSRTMPVRIRHSRHGSRVSQASIVSRGSLAPNFNSRVGENKDGGEEMGGGNGGNMSDGDDFGDGEKSIVSVRKSTMDLISLYREQEVIERERVLSLVRVESLNAGGM